MTTKIANTFFILLFISCNVAEGYNPSLLHFKVTMRSAINAHSKALLDPPAINVNYNETTIKEELARSGVNSSSWDEFNVYVAPQHGLKSADRIVSLPGQPKVDFRQFSGYVTVDERAGKALFYYFVESAENRFAKPLVLWLNGGPGCSSLIGAMVELGPFRVMRDGKTLAVNPHAWNKVANIIFLESPAGVGFSYSNTTSDYDSSDDKATAQGAYTFLINWLERFPEYKNRDFYITGESYAGHYVPQLAKLILQKNKKATPTRVINLRGLAVGNAAIEETGQTLGRYDILYKHGLISSDVRATLINCEFNPTYPGLTAENCFSAANIFVTCFQSINSLALNAPMCSSSSNTPYNTKFDPCTEEYAQTYFNTPRVQEALRAKLTEWQSCSKKLTWNEQEPTILLTIKELMASGLRVWLFSGDTDAVVPVEGTEYAIKALGLSVKTERYTWYNAPKEVGGYAVEYHNLTFVTVKDAGHFVPSYEPARALTIFTSFLQGKLPPASKL